MIVLFLQTNSCDYHGVSVWGIQYASTDSEWMKADILLIYCQCFASYYYYRKH
jgi:hypothetical protein